jgi:hypothetical protein
MRTAAMVLGVSVLAACGGTSGQGIGGSSLVPSALVRNDSAVQPLTFFSGNLPSLQIAPETLPVLSNAKKTANAFGNPGFETGKLPPWTSCNSKGVKGGTISTVHPASGKYDAFAGTTTAKQGEINGLSGVCQVITIPKNPYLVIDMYPVSTDTTNKNAVQLAYLYTANGSKSVVGVAINQNSTKWLAAGGAIPAKYISAYVGKKMLFVAGVAGSGTKGKYIGLWVDNASLTDGKP